MHKVPVNSRMVDMFFHLAMYRWGRGPHPYHILGEGDFLLYLSKNYFSETCGWNIVESFIFMKLNISVPKVSFPFVLPRKTSHVPSAGLRSKSVSRVSVPYWSSPIQHLASLLCVLHCGPSIHWGLHWGLHGYVAIERTGQKQSQGNQRAKN